MPPDLTPEAFVDFYTTLHGRQPFPWQHDLAARLIAGTWPEVIDVPTGLGKTSVIDCWIFALAAAARTGVVRSAPLRLCFVVDRRLIVDAAYEEAQASATALHNPTNPIVAAVATALTSLSGHQAAPLEVVRMRGGVTWESRWLARPDQPALIAGTVDQFGSRLLFRGYGVSENMRPINAALVGLDTWLVIDEAHLAGPLACTVERVVAQQSRTAEPRRALRITRMSATPGPTTPRAFVADPVRQMESTRLPDAAREAAKRLRTHKPASLVDVGYLASGGKASKAAQQLGVALAGLAGASSPEARVIGVVANTIRTARSAFQHLRQQGQRAVLLIGRCREFERTQLLDTWLGHIEVGSKRAFEGRAFVVATQTIEVGVNLDFDLLVTECAPWSSLVQRFGRVNRVGDRDPQGSVIVYCERLHRDDAVYEGATQATWEFLTEHAVPVTVASPRDLGKVRPGDEIDMGPLEVRTLTSSVPTGARAPERRVPVALVAHFERWACTKPAPWPDQEVGPFLHGAGTSQPDVSVAWRAGPPDLADGERDAEGAWQEWLRLSPPVEWEFVSVPIWELRGLLSATTAEVGTSDLEGSLQPMLDEASGLTAEGPPGVLYRGRDEQPVLIRSVGMVTPGDRVVLRSDVGGHDEFGWTGQPARSGEPAVPDVADLVPSRRRGAHRISWEVLLTWGLPDHNGELREAFALVDEQDQDSLVALFDCVAGATEPPDPAQSAGIPHKPKQEPFVARYADVGLWPFRTTGFLSPRPSAAATGTAPVERKRALLLLDPGTGVLDAVDDEDAASSSQTGARLPLAAHNRDVGAVARAFAEHLGLDAGLVRAIELAGEAHDLGKADARFQVMLHDGSAEEAALAPEPLAKSGRDSRDPVARRSAALAGVPRSFRHEAVSERLLLQLVADNPDAYDDVDVDLVAHLVSAHHGHARPLLPAILDNAAPLVSVEHDGQVAAVLGAVRQVAWTHPSRFARLNERYGIWGLAELETVVRLADMLCSEQGAAR